MSGRLEKQILESSGDRERTEPTGLVLRHSRLFEAILQQTRS
jgi:hypothetical protein